MYRLLETRDSGPYLNISKLYVLLSLLVALLVIIIDSESTSAGGTASQNVAPVAVGDVYFLQTGSLLTVSAEAGVLANDTDGLPLTVVLAVDATDGTLSLAGDGSFTYSAGPTFDGEDSFKYRADNGSELSPFVTVSLNDAFEFEDVTIAAGIDGFSGAPLENSYIHTASWGDVNGDGWLDLFIGTFVGGPTVVPDKLLINNSGVFTDSGQTPVEISGRAAGSVFADLDSDGDLDLYVSNNYIPGFSPPTGEPSHLFRNDDGVFVDVTLGSGIDAQSRNGREVGVLDYNGDGLLDLFIVADSLRGSGPTVLLRNLGNFQFDDVAATAGIPSDIHGLGLAIGDLTGNGWPDIFVAGEPNQFSPNKNFLLVAEGDGAYHKSDSTVFDWTPFTNGNEDWVSSAAFGDLNRDGMLDLLVGHHFGTSAELSIGAPLRVYMNRGLDVDGDPDFEDITVKIGLPNIISKSPHVEIQDFNNDGWPDLYTSLRIDTATGIAPLVFMHSGVAADGDPTFYAPDIVAPHYYAGGPVADYDRDGRLDVFLPEWRSVLDEGAVPSLLLRNVSQVGSWLDVRVQAGSNRSGIGAKVKVFREGMGGNPAGLIGYSEISTGFGFSSSGPALVHFGLAQEVVVDVVIEMPVTGLEHVFASVATNQLATFNVDEVNATPSFTMGPDQVVTPSAGLQSIVGWATAISAGPTNEVSQSLSFIVTNDNNTLFAVQPAISSTGTLTFTPDPTNTGVSTVSVSLQDDGGTANGGVDTSPIDTYTITVRSNISGIVKLQGVTLSNQAFIDIGPTVTLAPTAGVSTITVASDGTFELTAVPAGTYTITAIADGFQPYERRDLVIGTSDIDMPTVNLMAGLVNADTWVDAADMSLVVSSFGTSTSDRTDDAEPLPNIVDLNGDGAVSAMDISLVVSNLTLFGTASW